MSKPTLHLLMGLPGSGKTTLARKLHDMNGALRLSSDDFRLILFPKPAFSQEEHDVLYNVLDHNVTHLLQAGKSVVYDANLNRRIHRDEKYQIAKQCNADIMLWWLRTPSELSRQRRIEEQNHTLVPTHETPEDMFDRIAGVFEPPQEDEPHVWLDGSNITEAAIREAAKDYEF